MLLRGLSNGRAHKLNQNGLIKTNCQTEMVDAKASLSRNLRQSVCFSLSSTIIIIINNEASNEKLVRLLLIRQSLCSSRIYAVRFPMQLHGFFSFSSHSLLFNAKFNA